MLGSSYSTVNIDLKNLASKNTSQIGALGAISASVSVIVGIPVVDEIYQHVSKEEDVINATKKQEYLDKLYEAYTKFKITESVQLRLNDFVMPLQASDEFSSMLEEDVSKLGSNVTTIAKIYKNLAESQYKNIKETIDKVKKRDVTNQFRVDGGARFYGLARIIVDGKEQSLAEYIVEKKTR